MSRGGGRGNWQYSNNGRNNNYNRGGGGKKENTWMADLPIGPRNDCFTCGAIMEEKTPQNGGAAYWVCSNCAIAGRPKLNHYQQQQPQQQTQYQAPAPLAPTMINIPPTPSIPSINDGPTFTETILEDISEKLSSIDRTLNLLVRMGNTIWAAQKVSKRQFGEMMACTEEEGEEPETQPSSPVLGEEKKQEVITNDLKKKFMAHKRAKNNQT